MVDFKDFAQDRSHRDVESTGEYGRLMVQFVAGANGLAATAILTLIGAVKSSHLATSMPLPLASYLAGLFLALRSAVNFYAAQDQFASMWEQRSYGTADGTQAADRLFRTACLNKDKAFTYINLGLLLFIFGSGLAAAMMYAHFSHDKGIDTPTELSLDCASPGKAKIRLFSTN